MRRKKMFSGSREEEIRHLGRGDYFGEKALLNTEYRTANVLAESKEVQCFVFDRE